VLLALALVLIIGAVGLVLWLRTSLPQLEGDLTIAALSAPVTVTRDAHGVPRIKAETMEDAYNALGYVHAQDRLFQMEMMRRVGRGRLSEVAGSMALPFDRRMRTFGLVPLVEAEAAALSPRVRAAFEAYAGGVNAFLARQNGALPPEFLIVPEQLDPWTVEDSLLWLKLMSLTLTADWSTELKRAALARELTLEQIADLYPIVKGDVTFGALRGDLPSSSTIRQAHEAAAIVQEGAGSNWWVTGSSQTLTGKPILANDPHLGFMIPNTWYLVRIETPEGKRIGATAPGFPLVVLGHNGSLAWGFTNGYSDTSDVFVEKVDPADPGRYLTPEGSAAFHVREETINVRFGDPVVLKVRSTRHGPVISDGRDQSRPSEPPLEDGNVLALAHTGLMRGENTAEAILRAGDAGAADEFLAALDGVVAPQQNIAFADTDGRFGFYSPALIPIRKQPPGLLPVPGWDGSHDWEGFIPYDELPRTIDPASGELVNANNRPVGFDYPYYLGTAFTAPMRAEAIAQALDKIQPTTIESSAGVQMDGTSLAALRLLESAGTAPAEEALPADLAGAMGEWDGQMLPGRPEPLVFHAWLRELTRVVYADELGPVFEVLGTGNIERLLHAFAKAPHWCDDRTTDAVENCSAAAAQGFGDAYALLTERFGDNWREWRWGEAHHARFRHRPMGRIPVLAALFNRSIPHGGSRYAPNAGVVSYDEDSLFAQVHGATLRAVYDLADLDNSRFMLPLGQSGNVYSQHYDDLLPLWAEGEMIGIGPLDGPVEHVLHLRPAE